MLQRLGVRGKILAVVAVPILVLVLAAGFITFTTAQQLSAAQNSEQLIETLDRARGLEAQLQAERREAVNFAHTIQFGESTLGEAQVSTDEAAAFVDQSITEANPDNAEELRAQVWEALGTNNPDELFEDERALELTQPAAPEEGEEAAPAWVEFPSDDAIAGMQEGYAAASSALTDLAAAQPDGSELRTPLNTLAFRIDFESTTATSLFVEPQAYRAALEEIFPEVDSGIAGLIGSTAELEGNESNESAVASLAAGEAAVENLAGTRARLMSGEINVNTLSGFYRQFILTIVNAADDVSVAMTERDLVATMQAYGDIDALIENMYYEQTQFERLIRAGAFLPGEAAQARNLIARTDISLEEAQASSAGLPDGEPVPAYGASVSADAGDQVSYESVRAAILQGLDSSLVGERQAQWPTQVDEEIAAYTPIRDELWGQIEDLAAADSQSALLQTILTAIAAVVIVVISLIVALVIARRIIGPLRRLTTTATAVRSELPRLVERVALPGETVDVSEVQIPVESRDEIGRLAEAFNGVNAATLTIAGEQAALRGSISEMFVNVARRDQVLLNRQLASIDEMERTEDDPNTLTKLFALDHLATRMRRNSESLLVLAGIDTGRRLRRSMPLSDVIRTASSEIELYERVQLELDADPSMLGHSALTAAHLFAELLENATVFSDPGSPVVVRTAEVEGSVVVEIEDSGIGMTESELAEANNRVASTAASEILGAQRLGLFVVGRIARRVGARVEVASKEGEGTVATITMPASLFEAHQDDIPAAHVTSSAVDAQTQAPAALVSHDAAEEINEVPAKPTGAAALASYTPTAIEQGTSLLGRGGEEPQQDAAPYSPETAAEGSSIDDLIAADAAEAPEAAPADVEGLTAGTSATGLPTRRRREAPAPADAEREANSVVGLPARATDAQLSALQQEDAGGFTPSVAASEVSPQSPEDRASMFRGFRSRREGEDVEAPEESVGHAARREALAGADAPAEPAIPSLEPEGSEDSDDDHRGAAVAGAGIAGAAAAAGAAAFFSRRGRDDAPPAESAAAAPAEPQIIHDGADAGEDSLGGAGFGAGAVAGAALAGAAGGSDDVQEDEPVDITPEPEPEPELPKYALDADEETGTPGFRMPKFAPAMDEAPADEAPADEPVVGEPAAEIASADEPSLDEPVAEDEDAPAFPDFLTDPHGLPVVEPEEAESPALAEDDVAVESELATEEPAPLAIPMLEDDEPAAAELDQPEPEEEPAPAPAAPMAPWAAVMAQPAPQQDEPAPYPGPVDETPAAPVADGPAETPYGGVEQVSLDEPATAPSGAFMPEGAAATPAEEPRLDDLIQSAVEEEHKPGFFSRLFGRGKKEDVAPEPASTPEPIAPISGAIPVGGFAPEPVEQAPEAVAEQVAQTDAPAPPQALPPMPPMAVPTAGPALYEEPEPEQAPPAVDRSAASFFPSRTPQEPAPAPEPASPESPSGAFEPEPQSSFAPEPAPQATPEPQAPPASAPAAPAPQGGGAWMPTEAPEQQEESGVYSPDQLAQATGWEAAGASALQAAEPEVQTSYQPVIQPEAGGSEPSADFTSEVFSEFSSLASQRPKVEKTRAGLQRRRPTDAKPVEVKPIEEEVSVKPAERDADAVRNRFSSFYSGTQRARTEAAEHDQQLQTESKE